MKNIQSYCHNPKILFRNTGDWDGSAIDMDILEYVYKDGAGNSNLLLNVTDSASSGDVNGFIDGNSGTSNDDYEYDLNDFRGKSFEKAFDEGTERSSLILDRNKGIESITYNYLNLPTEVYWDGDHKITYLYNVHPVK